VSTNTAMALLCARTRGFVSSIQEVSAGPVHARARSPNAPAGHNIIIIAINHYYYYYCYCYYNSMCLCIVHRARHRDEPRTMRRCVRGRAAIVARETRLPAGGVAEFAPVPRLPCRLCILLFLIRRDGDGPRGECNRV